MSKEEKWEKVVDTIDSEDWDFEKKKELIGVFKAKRENVGENESTIYYVENKDGIFSFWEKTMIKVLFKNIEIGEEVKIVFLGMRTPKKGGKPYFNYEVSHRKSAFSKIEVEEEIPVIEEKDDIGEPPF